MSGRRVDRTFEEWRRDGFAEPCRECGFAFDDHRMHRVSWRHGEQVYVSCPAQERKEAGR